MKMKCLIKTKVSNLNVHIKQINANVPKYFGHNVLYTIIYVTITTGGNVMQDYKIRKKQNAIIKHRINITFPDSCSIFDN